MVTQSDTDQTLKWYKFEKKEFSVKLWNNVFFVCNQLRATDKNKRKETRLEDCKIFCFERVLP